MMVEPGTREVVCAVCSRPAPLATARAFAQGENEHGEPVYTLACAGCVDEQHDRPLREFLKGNVPDVSERATLLVGMAALGDKPDTRRIPH